MKKSLLTMAATLMALPVASFAGQITYNLNNSGLVTQITQQATSWGTDPLMYIDLPKFDSQLGTLTGVQLTLIGSASGQIYVENDDSSNATVASYLGATVIGAFSSSYCSAGCSVTANPIANFSDLLEPFTLDNFATINPAGARTYSNIFTTDTVNSSTLSEQQLLDALTGSGIFQIAVQATGNSSASGGGNLYSEIQNYAGAQAAITYFYTETEGPATPEPATWALIGTSLLGIGLAKRRKAF